MGRRNSVNKRGLISGILVQETNQGVDFAPVSFCVLESAFQRFKPLLVGASVVYGRPPFFPVPHDDSKGLAVI
jgi:hypothetical protein